MTEEVETYLKDFDKFLNKSKNDYKTFVNNRVEATRQTLYDVGFIDRFESEEGISLDYITFKKREEDIWRQKYLLTIDIDNFY